jgi:arylsulfatase A-like enzyme
MQMQAGDALDISKETDATREMYGIGDDATDSYGKRCLMARRLAERGVRYIQIYVNGNLWDHHTNLESGMRSCSLRTDKPIAGLLADLKQRGLFKDTLVIWGAEFGRLPISQLGGSTDGRDHNPRGFSLWMAGAGVKPGISYGNTDELGYKAVENPVSITDWQATVLHLLGLDYQRLTFDQSGLKEKLTSVYEAKIVQNILA